MIGRGLGLMHATEQASNEGVMERCVRDGRGVLACTNCGEEGSVQQHTASWTIVTLLDNTQ